MTWGDSSMLEQALFQESDGGSNPTSPLQLKFVVVKAKLACSLNKKWHSRLPEIHWSNVVRNKHEICFAGIFESNYICSAIWSSPVARKIDDSQVLELRRMALSDKCPKNTATRMLGFMQRFIKKNMPQITLLISYQDADVHKGTIYKAANWTPVNVTQGFSGWSNSRFRNVEQSISNKVKWEYRLSPELVKVLKVKNNQLEML